MTEPRPAGASGPRGVAKVLLQSRLWTRFSSEPNPLLKFLADGNKNGRLKRESGWLSRSEAATRNIALVCNNSDSIKHLTEAKNQILVDIKREIDCVCKFADLDRKSTHTADPCHAYGVSQSKVTHCVSHYFANNCSTARTPNPRKGLTIYNLDRKRKEVYTPRNFFKKAQRIRCKDVSLTTGELGTAFGNLDPNTLNQCVVGAQCQRTLSVNMRSKIANVPQRTNGVINWRRLAEQVAGGKDNVQPSNKDTL